MNFFKIKLNQIFRRMPGIEELKNTKMVKDAENYRLEHWERILGGNKKNDIFARVFLRTIDKATEQSYVLRVKFYEEHLQNPNFASDEAMHYYANYFALSNTAWSRIRFVLQKYYLSDEESTSDPGQNNIIEDEL